MTHMKQQHSRVLSLRFGESPIADLCSCVVLALLTAFMIGAGDLSAVNPVGTLLLVVAAGATLGAVFPRHVLLTATILGLAVPTAHVLARMNSWSVESAPRSLWWALLVLVPAVVAAFAGSVLRRVASAR